MRFTDADGNEHDTTTVGESDLRWFVHLISIGIIMVGVGLLVWWVSG